MKCQKRMRRWGFKWRGRPERHDHKSSMHIHLVASAEEQAADDGPCCAQGNGALISKGEFITDTTAVGRLAGASLLKGACTASVL